MFSHLGPQRGNVQGPPGEERQPRRICVHDCRCHRSTASPGKELDISGMTFTSFRGLLLKTFSLRSNEKFVLVTTDRTILDSDNFEKLKDSCTLYLLHRSDQELPAAMEEHITFTPHYDTLIQSGLHEYYDSEGQTPLTFTLAELIDNSLWATSKNTEMRKIEIRMVFDESAGSPAIIALDNGCGMTSEKLTEWATYRCSKFNRRSEEYVRPGPVRRSLTSDISYFGVGGKQAIFYIGDSVRMITKPADCPDVHELVLSKEDFKTKEQNNKYVYQSVIKNRKPGDFSHVTKKNELFLHSLINEETGKKSFTAVVITGVRKGHLDFVKQHFNVLTRQLAHTYHYYIHGVNGNDPSSSSAHSDSSKIDIKVTLRERPPRSPRVLNLREIDDDMQSLYIKAAADTFEFKATTGVNAVEGIIRYHPFLYDKETYPEDPQAPLVEEGDDESEVQNQARGKRPIFECFWNGRLIPNTTVEEFDWCAWNAKGAKAPKDCYSRFSGVLFTDDKYHVTQNKLTFMDLEQKVRSRETIFTRVVNGQEKRSNIQKEFTQWLKECHEKLDKQVEFVGFQEIVTRPDMTTKKMAHPWAKFNSIKWDGKIYKTGQLVKSQKTNPLVHGTVLQFLLYGQHDRDVFATGGVVEVCLEPKALYNKNKFIPISKIDRNATEEGIKKNIDYYLSRLPHELRVSWPEGGEWPQNGSNPAGTPLGPLRVEIMNKRQEEMSAMPAVNLGIKLCVELMVVKNGKNGPQKNKEVCRLVAPHLEKWGFWFTKNETLTDPGSYTLSLKTLIKDTSATQFGGRDLPSSKIHFTITAGKAEAFDLGEVSSPLRVGEPFDIHLQIKDAYGNSTTPPASLLPQLGCRSLQVSYDTVNCSGSKIIIKGVKATGKILNDRQAKKFDLRVTLQGLKKPTQSIKISLLPGAAHSLHVKPDDEPIVVQNGNSAQFHIEVHDEAGNITAHPKQIVCCKVPGLLSTTVDFSRTGTGELKTEPIELKIIKGEPQQLTVQFAMPNQRNVKSVVRELTVTPSTRVSQIVVYFQDEDCETIEGLAGDSLENLFYKLYDEAGTVVPLTPETASKIKVNWTDQVNKEDLVLGKLPDVQVPMQVEEEQFCQVSYQEQRVTASFTIIPRPDEPAILKLTLLHDIIKLGEALSGINLELVDKYGNATKTLTADCVDNLTVEAEDLDKEAVTFKWAESSRSVDVAGIRFLSGKPGIKKLIFTYQTFSTYAYIYVIAGEPAELKLVSGPMKPLQVINGHSISTPFLLQLVDMWGNVCPDVGVLVELKSSPPGLTVSSPVSQPVDSEGNVFFTVKGVSGPRGRYQLDFNGSFNLRALPGPTVGLTVLPDPNKPVSLSVEYNTAEEFPAGGTFPVFSVTVVSDEGSPMTTIYPADVTMLLWEGESPQPPMTATELKCSIPMENERTDCFHFRDKPIPESAGQHTIQFSLHIDENNFLFSDQITINVVANQPVKLAPESPPPPLAASCCKDIAKRTLLQNMTLRIMDTYGNPAGEDLNGQVIISIINCSGAGEKPTPLFEGRVNRYELKLVKGHVHVDRLAIMENSPGVNGSVYILRFQPNVPAALAPFELTFRFYDEAVKQQEVLDLLKKREDLKSAVKVHKQVLDDYSETLSRITERRDTASHKVASLRFILNRNNVTLKESIADIDRVLSEKTAEVERLRTVARRAFCIRDDFTGQQDVLGMVGHLAYVEDDAAARVISWQMNGHMDCVVTRTTTAARRIYDHTRGQQQVMPLDALNPTQMDRPLPHRRNGRDLFQPPGNPVFARDLLIFPQNKETCAIVFANFLRETILIDDLDSANDYRLKVVQNKIQCPTILTRAGDRVNSLGNFGGAQNKAPPITSLKVFGTPPSKHVIALEEQIVLLRQYREAVEKQEKAKKEYDDHSNMMSSPPVIKKQQDKERKEKQLEEIERQLISPTMQPLKRALEDTAGPSGITPKRAK